MQTYSVQQLLAVDHAFSCHETMVRQLAYTCADAEYVSFGYVTERSAVLVHLFPDGLCDVLEAGANSPEGRHATAEVCLAIVDQWASRKYDYSAAQQAYEKITGKPMPGATA